MDNPQVEPEVGTPADAPSMGFAGRLTGMFMEPKATFEDIDRRTTWLGIFIVFSLLAVAQNYAITSRMDYETFMRKAIEMNPITRNMPEEQKEAAIAQQSGSFQRYSQVIFAPLGILVSFAIMAGAFLVCYLLMGASLKFKKALAVCFWGAAPAFLVQTLIGILLVYLKDPETLDINPANNVTSNLGILVSEREQPVLASLLSSIDIFSFWTIFLLSLGFATVSQRKLTVGKAATVVVILWLVWVAGKAGFAAL